MASRFPYPLPAQPLPDIDADEVNDKGLPQVAIAKYGAILKEDGMIGMAFMSKENIILYEFSFDANTAFGVGEVLIARVCDAAGLDKSQVGALLMAIRAAAGVAPRVVEPPLVSGEPVDASWEEEKDKG
jgi:hypothetical protein